MSKPKQFGAGAVLGGGCFLLFTLPFAAVGVGATGYLIYYFAQWGGMQSWVEVPAIIEHAELQTHHDSEGGSTYSVKALYSYEYGGTRYSSERVSITDFSDNVSSWHQDKAEELRGYLGREFRCYVDPGDPTSAVLYRDIRIAQVMFITVFALAFGIVGIGLFGAALWGMFSARREAVLSAQYPDEPWMWQENWAEGEIRSDAKLGAIVILLFGIVWSSISFPILFILPEEVLEKGNYLGLIGLIFPVIGVVILWFGGVQFLRWRKYGDSLFLLDVNPGTLGGYLCGRVLIPRNVDAPDGFAARLYCEKKRESGSGKNKSTHTEVVWEDTLTLAAPGRSSHFGAAQIELPVEWPLPYDLPETDLDRSDRNWHEWHLEVKAETPGLDYDSNFEVPVFKTPHSNPGFTGDNASTPTPDARAAAEPMPTELNEKVVRLERQTDGSAVFVYPRLRNLGGAIILTLMAPVFSGVPIFLVYEEGISLFTGVFIVAFGGAGLLLTWGALWFWLHQMRVHVRPGGITVDQSLVFYRWTKHLDEADLQEIEPHSNMEVNGKPIYQIRAKVRGRKHVPLGSGFQSRKMAELTIQHMVEALRR